MSELVVDSVEHVRRCKSRMDRAVQLGHNAFQHRGQPHPMCKNRGASPYDAGAAQRACPARTMKD